MREILGGSNIDVLSATNLTLKHVSGGEVVARVFVMVERWQLVEHLKENFVS